jgi:uncharacterized protein
VSRENQIPEDVPPKLGHDRHHRRHDVSFFEDLDLDALLAAVRESSAPAASLLHGELHWRAVASVGAALLAHPLRPEGVDAAVVLSFALLHDSQRRSDGTDPDHGPRAAAFARRLAGGLLPVSNSQLALLERALRCHTGTHHDADPTVGMSWDADRLCLWRVGTAPDAAYLSTLPALDENLAAMARRRADPPGWTALAETYRSLA